MTSLTAAVPADKEADRGRVGFAKVSRYRAGKPLDGAYQQEAGGIANDLKAVFVSNDEAVRRTPVEAAVIVKKSDPRLARLARTDVAQARGEGVQRHRRALQEPQVVRRAQAQPVKPGKGDEATATDAVVEDPAPASVGEDMDAVRMARRQRALELQREAEQPQRPQASESEYETDEDSEYTSESEDDETGKLAKPVFVAKSDRETIMEKERLALEEQQLKEEEQKRQEARKAETKAFVGELIDLEKARAASKADVAASALSDVDTDTDSDEEDAEFEAWKRRELHRIKREQAMRDPASKPEGDNLAAGGTIPRQARPKLRFLQKYYHKGAFFQSAADDERGTVGRDEIYDRDFTGATGEDKFDKEALPAVMQVRNFGRAGRTKWTHLAAEDTTFVGQERGPSDAGPAAPLYGFEQENPFEDIKKKMELKGAGRAGDLSKPSRKKAPPR